MSALAEETRQGGDHLPGRHVVIVVTGHFAGEGRHELVESRAAPAVGQHEGVVVDVVQQHGGVAGVVCRDEVDRAVPCGAVDAHVDVDVHAVDGLLCLVGLQLCGRAPELLQRLEAVDGSLQLLLVGFDRRVGDRDVPCHHAPESE